MNTEPLYLNGVFMAMREARISVEDRGFQLGDGVYKVVKSCWRRAGVAFGSFVWVSLG